MEMKGYKYWLNLTEDQVRWNRNKVTKVKRTDKGVKIFLFNNFITLTNLHVTWGKNGTAKVVTKVNKNYCKPYQYTSYENQEGEKCTLKQYRELQK